MASAYPTALDSAATLYNPVDRFSTVPLEATLTAALNAGVTSAQVNSTTGFSSTWGVLTIDDELIVYESKDSTHFLSLHRGAFGTTDTGHANGSSVRALFVSGYIKALQDAVIAIQTLLGTAGAYNFINATDAQVLTGVLTFQNGLKLGSGHQASTGQVNFPNAQYLAWRNQADSSDLTVGVGSNDHLQVPIIDFNVSQTFPDTGIQDATTTDRGLVSIAPSGCISVSSGEIDVAPFVASGASHKKGAVPDPGASAGTTKFLREDASWAVPNYPTTNHRNLAANYSNGTGTAGTNNTVMVVKTIVLPANTLAAVNDRLRVRAYYKASGMLSQLAVLKVGPSGSEVTVCDRTLMTGSMVVLEAWLHYLDNTHANLYELENGALGALSNNNVSGFTWNAAQNIIVTQDAVMGQAITVYDLVVDVFPAT